MTIAKSNRTLLREAVAAFEAHDSPPEHVVNILKARCYALEAEIEERDKALGHMRLLLLRCCTIAKVYDTSALPSWVAQAAAKLNPSNIKP